MKIKRRQCQAHDEEKILSTSGGGEADWPLRVTGQGSHGQSQSGVLAPKISTASAWVEPSLKGSLGCRALHSSTASLEETHSFPSSFGQLVCIMFHFLASKVEICFQPTFHSIKNITQDISLEGGGRSNSFNSWSQRHMWLSSLNGSVSRWCLPTGQAPLIAPSDNSFLNHWFH